MLPQLDLISYWWSPSNMKIQAFLLPQKVQMSDTKKTY